MNDKLADWLNQIGSINKSEHGVFFRRPVNIYYVDEYSSS